jgi:hypothetical protein
MRLIGVNGMRHKNAGAEKSHQYCCNLNHGTHPYAQPALTNTLGIGTGLFRDDFVAPSKWFRRLFLGVPAPFRRHKGHKFFIPASSPPGGANPTKSPDVSRRRRHGLTSVISSPPQGPMRKLWRTNMGEVIQFVSKAELERRRLSREGRARNSNILPPVASVSEPRDQKSELADS